MDGYEKFKQIMAEIERKKQLEELKQNINSDNIFDLFFNINKK